MNNKSQINDTTAPHTTENPGDSADMPLAVSEITQEAKALPFNSKLAATNTSVFAFIGDATYEIYVRKHAFNKGILRPDRLNTVTVGYVRAEAQACALDGLIPELADDEASVARRGKNHKITSMPRNVDPKIYKKATAFEALLGYLDVKGDRQRLEYLIQRAFEIIESSDIKISRKK